MHSYVVDIGSLFGTWSDFNRGPKFIYVECLCYFCCIFLFPPYQSLLICAANLSHTQIRCPASQPGHSASVKGPWDKDCQEKMMTCYFIDHLLSLDLFRLPIHCLRSKARPSSIAHKPRPHPALPSTLSLTVKLFISPGHYVVTWRCLFSTALKIHTTAPLPRLPSPWNALHLLSLPQTTSSHLWQVLLSSADRMSPSLPWLPKECCRHLSYSPDQEHCDAFIHLSVSL